MNKPHKWAKEIAHYVNGGEVEHKYTDAYSNRNKFSTNNYDLLPEDCLRQFEQDTSIFRVKPKKKIMKVAVFKNKYGKIYVANVDHAPVTPTQISDMMEIEYEDLS